MNDARSLRLWCAGYNLPWVDSLMMERLIGPPAPHTVPVVAPHGYVAYRSCYSDDEIPELIDYQHERGYYDRPYGDCK